MNKTIAAIAITLALAGFGVRANKDLSDRTRSRSQAYKE